MRRLSFMLLPVPLLLGGCLVRAAADVVTLPVRAVGQAADWATTSQDEADRNYGRRMRKAEAREGRERREWERRCRRAPDRCEPYDGYVAAREVRR